MELIPIPYFGMIMSLFVAPLLTFGFIILLRKTKASVEIQRIRKEVVEIELKKEEIKYKLLLEENRKYDQIINDSSIK
jgi:energy-converting hydrogenase Eha subunit H